MTDALTRAADAVDRETVTARPTAIARAAILAFLDGIDPSLVTEAWKSGFANALDNIPASHIGAINDALGRSASLAVLAVLRALVQEDGT